MNHIHLKIDLDVMQSHPLHRTIDNIHSPGFGIITISPFRLALEALQILLNLSS